MQHKRIHMPLEVFLFPKDCRREIEYFLLPPGEHFQLPERDSNGNLNLVLPECDKDDEGSILEFFVGPIDRFQEAEYNDSNTTKKAHITAGGSYRRELYDATRGKVALVARHVGRTTFATNVKIIQRDQSNSFVENPSIASHEVTLSRN
jgi:hypothetical protein